MLLKVFPSFLSEETDLLAAEKQVELVSLAVYRNDSKGQKVHELSFGGSLLETVGKDRFWSFLYVVLF